MESSSAANTESWAASWRSSSPLDMRNGEGAEPQREGAKKNALRAKGKGDGKCNEQRDARAQPVSGVTQSRLTMLPKLELHRGSSMEFSSGTRVDIRKRWKKDLKTK